MTFKEKIFGIKILNRILISIANILITLLNYINRNYSDNNKIVILSIHKIGDSIFTIPAINAIKKKYKSITIFCFNECITLFKYIINDNIDFVGLDKKNLKLNGRIADRSIRKRLKKIAPGIIFDLTGSILSASILYNSKAKYIIGFNEEIFKKIYTHFNDNAPIQHMTDLYIRTVKNFLPNINIELNLYNVHKHGNMILIHPFAGWSAKEWGINKFIKLSELLNYKFKTALVSQPGKLDEFAINEIQRKGIKLLITKSLDELINIIKCSTLLIGNDTGPIQIANLLGVPTYAIFGPTNPYYHIPLHGLNGFIFKKILCSPSNSDKLCFTNAGRDGCSSFECMKNLGVNEVGKSILDFIFKNHIIN